MMKYIMNRSDHAETRSEEVGGCINVPWLLRVAMMGLFVVLVSGGVSWGQADSTLTNRQDSIKVTQAASSDSDAGKLNFSSKLVFGVLVLAAILGGIIGLFYNNWLFKKRRKSSLKVDADKLYSEILNIKTEIQIMYVAVPIITLVLTFFGLHTQDSIDKQVNEQAVQHVDAIMKRKSAVLKEMEDKYNKIKLSGGVVTMKDLEKTENYYLSKIHFLKARIQDLEISNRNR